MDTPSAPQAPASTRETVEVVEVDLRDEPRMRAMQRALLAAHDADRPDAPFWWSEDEVLELFPPDDPEERFVVRLAMAGGEVAGALICFVPVLDNLDKVYADLAVHPAHRGRGVGDALVEEAVRVTRAEGRSRLIVNGFVPAGADGSHPVRAFAARHGFTPANTEVRRTLRLPLPAEELDRWAAEAAPHHTAYTIETHTGLVPPHLRASLVELENQLAVDAPTGEIDFEAGRSTVEVHEQQMERLAATGRTILVAVAVRDGAAVAHSTLSVPPAGAVLPHASQWGTYVHRDHRGHRLGLATKVANLRVLQERFPERTLLHTTNSPVNGPMVAIYEDLGFRPVDALVEFLREV